MNFFSTNIRVLRDRRKVTQDIVARSLETVRSTINSMENGTVKNPSIVMLVKFSDYYKVSIDNLIRLDLRTMSAFQLNEFMLKEQSNGTS